MKRVYNFSAGPAILPEEVLLEASEEMLASGHLYYVDSLKMPKTGIHCLIDDDNLE